MSIEVQLRDSALTLAVSDAVQQQLFYACLPSFDGNYVDHVDVSRSRAAELVPGADGTLRLRTWLDVYIVTGQQLSVSTNAVPQGATTPAGQLVATYVVSLSGEQMPIVLDDLDSDPPNPLLAPVLSAVKAAMPVIPPVDFGPVFTTLELAAPQTARIDLANGVVALRFDAVGPVTNHLLAGQDWALFVGGDDVEEFVGDRLAGFVVPHLTLTPHWTPAGGLPRVTVGWRYKPDLPDPFTATGTGDIGTGLALVSPGPAATLRLTANWTLHLDLGSAVPGFVDNEVEKVVRGYIADAFDPAEIGATRIDDRSFFIDVQLPPLAIAGAGLRYTSLAGDAAGMTLGGTVRRIGVDYDTLSFSLAPFGRPTWFGTCRANSNIPKKLKLKDVSCWAWVDFSSYGTFCRVRYIGPSTALPYLDPPATGSRTKEVESVSFEIPATQARFVTKDVTILLQTSRGVRRINFGHPIVEVDGDGNVVFDVVYIDNFFHLTPEQTHVIDWLTGKGSGSPEELKPPPKEDPNWSTLLAAGRGLEVQLVTLSGLEPGELIRHRSPTHSIDVTADADGRAQVPVFLSLDDHGSRLSLERVNRQSLAGKFQIKAASFFRRAAVQGGGEEQVDLGHDGGITLTRALDKGTYRESITAEGIRLPIGFVDRKTSAAVRPGSLTALQPQPLPPKTDGVGGLKGVAEVLPIPGFEREPVSVARMDDGSAVLLSVDAAGRTRVAGRFSGPIGHLVADAGWGLARSTDRTYVFKVSRS